MSHSILGWIVIGIVAGWLTGKIMKGGGYGMLLDMVVGLIGAVIGGAIFRALGYGGPGEHGLIVSIIIATIGAVILTFLIHLFTGRRPIR
ncbi:MAG: GlsB/YeaQ/YmgE family stress response membrane protein [Acidobacteriaceae bacterium]|jgi:uncharacterized membrane protein YeaQ/YmgE (transglycosylase-associated protein family)